MTITLTDMRESLRGQRKADEAIFWFCNAWHSGLDSDLYHVIREVNFHPDQHRQKQIKDDPEILYCLDVLGTKFGPFVEAALLPIKFADVKENDVLIAGEITDPKFRLKYGSRFVCIEKGWPCRVYKWHGDLGVACAEDHHGKSFHALEVDERGYVVGFVR
jgi:hypothetical protein